MITSFFNILIAFVLALHVVQAQVTCSGTLSSPNPITSDVNVPTGGSCVLRTNVTGSVTVLSGASFRTAGVVQIFGSLASTGRFIDLGGNVVVNGGVSIMNANRFVTGPSANIGSISVNDVATFVHRGRATSVSVGGTGNAIVRGGNILGGGLSRSGKGSILLCGSTISGGISLIENEGGLKAVASGTCAPNTIMGSIGVEKGSGNIEIAGGELTAADVNVIEQTGNVFLGNSQLSDIGINQLTGSLTIRAMADSDTTISSVSGPILIENFSAQGDFGINQAGSSVTVRNSAFGFEGVRVNGAVGAVVFSNLRDVSIGASGNPSVTVTGTIARSGEFTSNEKVVLRNNNFSVSLVCSSNTNLSGFGNAILFGDGQCASGLK